MRFSFIQLLLYLYLLFPLQSQDNISNNNQVHLYSKTFSVNKNIPVISKWDHLFISLSDFSRTMHFGIYTNEQRQKTLLYLVKDRITFTGNNTFVIVNNQIVQITVPCLWQNGEVWIPIEQFVEIINENTEFSMNFIRKDFRIDFEKSDVNISGLELVPKENGLLIHIFALKEFDKKLINLAMRNGWFHIDIYGAKIDTNAISSIPGTGIVSKIQGIQLGETVSIAFKMKSDNYKWDPVYSDESNDFYINLRNKDDKLDDKSARLQMQRELSEQKKKSYINTIVLDAGHGGKDPGAIGYKRVFEKNIVLSVTLKLGKIIKQEMSDVEVIYTRDKDIYPPLWQRTKIANEKNGKIFVSIHANWNRNQNVSGCETYFLSADKDEKAKEVVLKENSVIKEFETMDDHEKYSDSNLNILATMTQSRVIRQSQYLASLIQESLKKNLKKVGINSNGVRQGPFWVLVGATMPNVLVEIGYISNKKESKLLKNKTTQEEIARAIFLGIKKFKEDIESAI